MIRRCLVLAAISFGVTLPSLALAPRDEGPDQLGMEEVLNRELWEFAKGTPYAEALRYVAQTQPAARARQSDEVVLPTGWKISPAGTQVELGRLPYEALFYAGYVVVLNTGYYGKDPQEVSVVDPERGLVAKTVPLNSLFPSARVGLDGDLYISGGFDRKVYRLNRELKLVREYPVGGYAAGLAAVDATHVAVAYMVTETAQGGYGQGRLAVLNTDTGAVERDAPTGYFPYAVFFVNGKLYLTLLGENKLLVFDTQLKPLKTLEVGRSPQALCTDGARLYVVNATSDDLSVVDTSGDSVVATIGVRHKGFRFGSSPTSCAVDGKRLYVTQAEIHAVAVFDLAQEKLLGFVPAGWYPTKVLLHGTRLYVLGAKGIRARRPNPMGPQPTPGGGSQYVLTLLRGSLSILPRTEVEPNLPAWTRQVEEGSPLYGPKAGLKLPIRHVFYIVKENRSYDQVLGDLGRGNGDSRLTLFGRAVTPNHHRLAEEFVTLDNFYVNGEISVLGHSFTTSGYASPFLEWLGNVGYSQRYKGYPYGTVPVVFSPVYLWDALEEKGVEYRVYGESYYIFTRAYHIIVEAYGPESDLARKFYARSLALSVKGDRGKAFGELVRQFYGRADTPEGALHLIETPPFARPLSQLFIGDDSLARALEENPQLRRKFAEYLSRYPFNYHSWDLGYSDLQRALDWKADFDKQLQAGRVARVHYIWLPNDHTAGTNRKFLDPFQLVAQNDAALGMIVEAIARSPIWRSSLILIVEDDAQNGPDHVDATRTVALAAGPFVRRGMVVSDRYDQLSLLRTVELTLGLEPLNLNDALAVPMVGIFNEQPDVRPYIAASPSGFLTKDDEKRYQELERIVRSP